MGIGRRFAMWCTPFGLWLEVRLGSGEAEGEKALLGGLLEGG